MPIWPSIHKILHIQDIIGYPGLTCQQYNDRDSLNIQVQHSSNWQQHTLPSKQDPCSLLSARCMTGYLQWSGKNGGIVVHIFSLFLSASIHWWFLGGNGHHTILYGVNYILVKINICYYSSGLHNSKNGGRNVDLSNYAYRCLQFSWELFSPAHPL